MSAWVRCNRGPRFCRRGLSVIYIVLIVVLLAGIVSLAVDVGRVRLARAELQTAADAAARSGALSLPVNSQDVINRADDAALDNQVIDTDDLTRQRLNTGVSLVPDEDVSLGVWSDATQSFTELDDNANTKQQDERRRANAVRVYARRLESRGNPLQLIFAPILPNGPLSSDVERVAIARVGGGPSNFGFVGIDSVDSNGNTATIDSMTPPASGSGGGVASDGNINLGNGNVFGDARPGIGKSLLQGPNSVVTGWTADLDYKLADRYPPITSVPPGAANIPAPQGKTYAFIGGSMGSPKSFTGTIAKNTKTITVTGYCKVYINADLDLTGCSITSSNNDPQQLEFIIIGAHAVDLGGTSQQRCHIYAPTSTVKVHGTPGFYGWIVGKTLSFLGTSSLHYDNSQKDIHPYSITLVK